VAQQVSIATSAQKRVEKPVESAPRGFSSALKQLDLRIEAALASKKQQDLEEVIADAEALHVDEEKLALVRQALAAMVSKQEVRKAVAAEQRALAKLAQAAGNPPSALHGPLPDLPVEAKWTSCAQAIEAGMEAQALCKAAGLKQSEKKLAKATKAVLEPFRDAVWPKVRALVHNRDIASLQVVLRETAAARLEEVPEWQATLQKANLMCAAKPNIDAALQSGAVGALRPAIEQARMAGLKPTDIIPAEQALASIERKAGLKWSLMMAMTGTSAPLLRSVIDDSEAAGFAARRLEEPIQLLNTLEELFEVAVGLCRALRSGDVARLRKMLETAERVGASRDPLCRDLIHTANREMQVISRRASARNHILEASSNRKSVAIATLPKAIKKGEAAGLKAEELDMASKAYTKALAQKAIEKAILQREVEPLRKAIKEGMRAKLPADEIRTAMRILKEEEALFAARELIEKSNNILSLEKAIENLLQPAGSDNVKCDGVELAEIRSRVTQYKNLMQCADATLKVPIVFDIDSTEIPMAELPKIHNKIKVLKQHSMSNVRVEAYSTNSSPAVAHKFSMERAARVVDLFKRAGCTNTMTTRAIGNPKGDRSRKEVIVVADVMGIGPAVRAQLLKGDEEELQQDLSSVTKPETNAETVPLYKLRKAQAPRSKSPARL